MNTVKSANQKTSNSLRKIFTNKEVWVAIASTLFLLIVFQIGAHVTAPGLKLIQNDNNSNIVSLLNLLGGGGLNRVSLFTVGVSPYITAQIIIQMLSTDIIKPLAELKKSGELGRRKLEFYTRLLAFPFAVATAYGALVLISNSNLASFVVNNKLVTGISAVPVGQRILMLVLFVSGTYIALFIADIISKKGVGNGTTLIIMSGIISSIPTNFTRAFSFLSSNARGDSATFISISTFVIYIFFYLFILFLILVINGAVRKIPIQQTGQGMVQDVENLPFLPIKLIPAGVVPVIFAGSLMSIPGTIGEFIRYSNPQGYSFIQNYLSLLSPVGLTIYAFLIVSFSFFYSHIQVNAEELAENFEKSGRFIPGINIGQATYLHIKKVIQRINWIGAPLLTVIAILPNVLTLTTGIPPGASLGGTGVVILISGTTQLWDAIKSTSTSVKYKVSNQALKEQIAINSIQILNQQDSDAIVSEFDPKAKNTPKTDQDSEFLLW